MSEGWRAVHCGAIGNFRNRRWSQLHRHVASQRNLKLLWMLTPRPAPVCPPRTAGEGSLFEKVHASTPVILAAKSHTHSAHPPLIPTSHCFSPPVLLLPSTLSTCPPQPLIGDTKKAMRGGRPSSSWSPRSAPLTGSRCGIPFSRSVPSSSPFTPPSPPLFVIPQPLTDARKAMRAGRSGSYRTIIELLEKSGGVDGVSVCCGSV